MQSTSLVRLVVLAAVVLSLSPCAVQASQLLLQVAGLEVNDDSGVPGYENWIPIDTMDFYGERPVSTSTGSTRSRGTAQLDTFDLTKPTGTATPDLLLAMTEGRIYHDAQLVVLSSDGAGGLAPSLVWWLDKPSVVRFGVSNTTGELTDRFSFDFDAIALGIPDGRGGFIFDGWDIESGTGWTPGGETTLPVVAPLPGDFNFDGSVDVGDYSVWRDLLGSEGAGLPADANLDDKIDELDYSIWQANLGRSLVGGALTSAPVPEPATWGFLVLTAVAFATHRRSTTAG